MTNNKQYVENPYEHIAVTLGHSNLFKRRISEDEVIQIISKYPVSQWLDLFAKIESFLIFKESNATETQITLAKALFPQSTLRRIDSESHPNDKIAIFTRGPLNILRKLAILYGESNNETEIPIPKIDISKIVLAAQDFHNDYDEPENESGNLENFYQFIIRNGYLNGNFEPPKLLVRAHKMYILQAQKIPFYDKKSFADFFNENVGTSIEMAMALSFALASPLMAKDLTANTIIDPKTFFQNLDLKDEIAESVIGSLVIDLPELKTEIQKELDSGNFKDAPIGYNLDVFRKTPLLKLTSGNLACLNLSCLFEKTTQNIIWLPKSQITGLKKEESKKLVIDLTNYRGKLFEEYIKHLCTSMVKLNQKISFNYFSANCTKDHEEIGDSILIQDGNVVIFEAKSRQFNETFKHTGDSEEDTLFIDELVKKAAKQIEIAGKKIKNGEVDEFPLVATDIKKIYPVIVTYDPVPMHGKVQRYIRERVKEFEYLNEDFFAPLEIIDISDLEQVMDVTDNHTLIDLLQEKNGGDSNASEANFNNFFANYIREHKLICNGWQKEQWDKFGDEVFEPNFNFK